MIYEAIPNNIKQACELLSQGQVIGLPTETVYGLAADAYNDRAVASIFHIKRRPAINPLIVHVGNVAQVDEIVQTSTMAAELMAAFWPGPLTLVLPRKENGPVSLLATAGLDTIGVRMPNHPIALELLHSFGRPLAAPSANLFMTISPTTALDVEQGLGDQIPLILDGGPCQVGVESTILDLTTDKPTLLRPGGVSVEDIEAVVGPIHRLDPEKNHTIKAPGMFKRHYAPSKKVRLNAADALEGEVFLGFGPYSGNRMNPDDKNLSVTGDCVEAAANLFQFMRQLDQKMQYHTIAVAPIPYTGLGLAINDRLQRAATSE